MPQVLNKHWQNIPDDAVNIMRGTKWGNPYKIGVHGDREQVIKLYESHIKASAGLQASLHELRDKDLVCCCFPRACHGDVLLRLANE